MIKKQFSILKVLATFCEEKVNNCPSNTIYKRLCDLSSNYGFIIICLVYPHSMIIQLRASHALAVEGHKLIYCDEMYMDVKVKNKRY